MLGQVLRGNEIRDQILTDLGDEVARLARSNIRPGLGAVLVGDDPASHIYVGNKIKACKRIGLFSETLRPAAESTTEEILAIVQELNERDDIDGILVQLPLPDHIDEDKVLLAIRPEKDVDGFHPMNVGKLATGQPTLTPCTPSGLIEILRRSEIPIQGKNAVIVGRSNIVGKPAALLLLAEHATVTICHSRTQDLAAVCREADILVAAIGRPAMITREFIRPGATVLDVGINRLTDATVVEQLFANTPKRLASFREKGAAVVGDVHPEHMREVAGAYTPVPGGVGPLTIAMLMLNTVKAARLRRGKVAMAVVGDFNPFRRLMLDAGQPEIAIENFERHYRLLCDRASGLIAENELEPVDELPDAAAFPTPSSSIATQLLAKTAIVKLNGGLGTTMGLDRAKSLLEVKRGYSFLDIIANQAKRSGVPLLLMNSFRTERDSLAALRKHRLDNGGMPQSFVQHQVPKVLTESLLPAEFPANPELAWCPPGHGDLYLALVTSGALQRLNAAGIEYIFVSNADNLGATLDSALLYHFAESGLDFMMEAADRTSDDRKGGHLALRGGALMVREVAQCSDIDKPSFQDIDRHRYFNIANIWINVERLAEVMEQKDNYMGLPLIRNLKTLNPKDPTTPEVYQLETAMGAAIEVFEKVAAVRVSRSRFAPVKAQKDLDRVRSDEYELTADFHLVRRQADLPDRP